MKEEVCYIKFESYYIPRKEVKSTSITFRNMIYWRSFKDKIHLFYLWLKSYINGVERVSFNKFLDTPRELVTEFQHIEMPDSNKNTLSIDVEVSKFDFKE